MVTPKINFVLCGIALLLLIIALALIWLTNIKKSSILIATFCTISCGILLYGASLSYASLFDESITFRQAFSLNTQSYSWENVQNIKYYDNLEDLDVIQFYVFSFPNDEELTIIQNGRLTEEIRIRIDHKIRDFNIPFERIHEW